jgi:uncharacterized protein YceK
VKRSAELPEAATSGPSCCAHWEQGCPGVYSGIRYYRDHVQELPPDGKIFFTLDLPLTMVADTILLPVSVFMEPTRPKYGFAPGCTWARKR